MALGKRDTKIIYIMAGLMLAYVVWAMGVEPVLGSYEDLSAALDEETEIFEKNQATLSEQKSIEEGYRKVEAQFPDEDPERDASQVFNEEVVSLVREVTGALPTYKPPTVGEIKGASGYEFLILNMVVQKVNLDKVAKLLKEFDQKGYLIQRVIIVRDSDLNKEDLTLEMDLGRIVKIEEEPEDMLGQPGSFRLNAGGARQ